jgi:hypothetical protein
MKTYFVDSDMDGLIGQIANKASPDVKIEINVNFFADG